MVDVFGKLANILTINFGLLEFSKTKQSKYQQILNYIYLISSLTIHQNLLELFLIIYLQKKIEPWLHLSPLAYHQLQLLVFFC